MMNYTYSAMSNFFNKKRSRTEFSDDDIREQMDNEMPMPQNQNQQKHFPKFIVIESTEEKPLSKLSPFVIEKCISSILGTPKSLKRLKNGTLLVECFKQEQVDNLLKNKTFFNIKVKIYPHPTLNSSKGVIRCQELDLCQNMDEIKTNLKDRGATDVYRIQTKRNGILKPTNTYILTFNTPVLPDHVIINYQKYSIQPYIPNPLRCFQCQKFGHHVKNCRAEPVCSKCSEKGHSFDQCENDPKCVNCGKDHPSFSKTCTIWKKEKEIQKVKVLNNITFEQARKEVESFMPSCQKPSYAEIVKPNQNTCPTCNIIIEELSKHFPDVAKAIKNKLKLANQTPEIPEKPQSAKHENTKPNEPQTSSKSSQIETPKQAPPKEKKEKQKTKQTPSDNKMEQNQKKTETKKDTKHRIARIEINENSTETVTESIPLSRNRYDELQNFEAEMDADECPPTWEDHSENWNDNPDEWKHSNA